MVSTRFIKASRAARLTFSANSIGSLSPEKQAFRAFKLIRTRQGRAALSDLYRRDIETIAREGAILTLDAPTLWANGAFTVDDDDYESISNPVVDNKLSVQFVRSVIGEHPEHNSSVFVAAPMGPYRSRTVKGFRHVNAAYEAHRIQALSLWAADADLITVKAMKTAVETKGCAMAAAETGIPYRVELEMSDRGLTPDGAPVDQFISELDAELDTAPLYYVVTGLTPERLSRVLRYGKPEYCRIRGARATVPAGMSDKEYALAMTRLRRRYPTLKDMAIPGDRGASQRLKILADVLTQSKSRAFPDQTPQENSALVA